MDKLGDKVTDIRGDGIRCGERRGVSGGFIAIIVGGSFRSHSFKNRSLGYERRTDAWSSMEFNPGERLTISDTLGIFLTFIFC